MSSTITHISSAAPAKLGGMEDRAVAALRRLTDKHGRAAVAQAIGSSDQTLYQIVSRRLTAKGIPRGVGRDLRERLNAAYPGWMDEQEPTPEEETPMTPHTFALQCIADALQAARDEPELLRATAAALEAINATMAEPRKRLAAG